MKPARQEILDKLKNSPASIPEKPDFLSPVFPTAGVAKATLFKKNLEKVNGFVYIFDSKKALLDRLNHFLPAFSGKNICCSEPKIQSLLSSHPISYAACADITGKVEAGITGCEYLVAETGSILVSSAQQGGRRLFIYPPAHIVIASKKQVVLSLEDGYAALSEKYQNNLPSQILLITGPSRTADIEKTLILGAHGPKELHVFLY